MAASTPDEAERITAERDMGAAEVVAAAARHSRAPPCPTTRNRPSPTTCPWSALMQSGAKTG